VATNSGERVAAQRLRDDLVHELYKWRVDGSRTPEWVSGFEAGVSRLARLEGKTQDEVHQEVGEDAERLADLEELDGDRTAKDWNPNPWAVCHESVGRKKTPKFERCVQDVKEKQE